MLGRFYYSSVHRPRHPHSVLFEIPLAVVSAGEAMQDEVPMLRFESGQVRTKTWMFREAIHARSADLETTALRVEMNIDSRCALSERFSVLQQVYANRLVWIGDAKSRLSSDVAPSGCVVERPARITFPSARSPSA